MLNAHRKGHKMTKTKHTQAELDTYYMNPDTGSVGSLEEWLADYNGACPDDKISMWPDGVPPSGLTEVESDGDDWWNEV